MARECCCCHVPNHTLLHHYCGNCLFIISSRLISCDNTLVTKGNVMLLWGSAHDSNVCERLSCSPLFVLIFFSFFFFPIYGYNPTLPRMFLTRFESCSYNPTLPLPRHTINSKENLRCCKGRRKKQFYFCLFCCCVCACCVGGGFLFVCF